MIKRHISKIAFSRDFGRQMRFIIGPRQTGKTTVAKETDFLILQNKKPWLMVEAKLSRSTIDYHHRKNRNTLGDISFVQVVRQENIAEKREDGLYQISASRFFA